MPATKGKFFRPAFGALLAVLCGVVLLDTPLGARWVNASYDYLFRFSNRPVTNPPVLILMDNDAYGQFDQRRGEPWDRGRHAELLQRLADDGAAMVVFDSFFQVPRDPPEKDQALAEAMRRQRCLVLMASQAAVTLEKGAANPALRGARPLPPAELFREAAGADHWGVAWLDPDLDLVVRRHWPFPAPGPYPSLAWTAARLSGAALNGPPQEQWLRYYGPNGAWDRLGYRLALLQTNYFRDRVVFIGTQPATSVQDEKDEFLTPYSRWTGETTGGVEIMLTAYLNLVNGDWLRRLAAPVELLVVVIAGMILGAGLCRVRPPAALALAAAAAGLIAFGAISWSHHSPYWFPWLVIAGGQVPGALAWALATRKLGAPKLALEPARPQPSVEVHPRPVEVLPDVPDYELLQPPFGSGSYGKVWLARNAVGQWQALKVVYRASFGQDAEPYEREFNGISRYKPVSDQHPGLLRIDFVSKKKEAGYFYYVMELGDPLDPGWEKEPSTYRPRDLISERGRCHGQKLPARECLRLGIALTEALDFLHRQGLTHRDIKPQNIIFVNGQPKLADVGLTSEIRPPDRQGTLVGTPGYMPPPPESPGTPQADIYALGMVLYVLSTGRGPVYFPELSTTLVDSRGLEDFLVLNAILLQACHPDRSQRFASAAAMGLALREAWQKLESGAEPPPAG